MTNNKINRRRDKPLQLVHISKTFGRKKKMKRKCQNSPMVHHCDNCCGGCKNKNNLHFSIRFSVRIKEDK